jgi:prevent-host-death family protein
MNGVWQLQEAKNKLSKVINEATGRGPQVITKHGVEVAIVLSSDDYRKLLASQKKLADFFRASPLAEVELDLTRDKSEVREAFIL